MQLSTVKLIGIFLLFLIITVVSSVSVMSGINRNASSANSNATTSGLTEDDVRLVIKDYLNENPEVIVSAYSNYQRKVYEEQQRLANRAIKEHTDELENDETTPFIGNPNASVTIVEFFDYLCGYCKRVLPTLVKLVENDKDLKVVFKELPILGPNSELISKAALATYVTQPDKYFDVHQALFSKRITGQAAIVDTLTQIGLNADTITNKMNDQSVIKLIDNNRELARSIGINGTPAFTINGEYISGIIDYSEFNEKIKAARMLAKK